jgi:hypothetical protein
MRSGTTSCASTRRCASLRRSQIGSGRCPLREGQQGYVDRLSRITVGPAAQESPDPTGHRRGSLGAQPGGHATPTAADQLSFPGAQKVKANPVTFKLRHYLPALSGPTAPPLANHLLTIKKLLLYLTKDEYLAVESYHSTPSVRVYPPNHLEMRRRNLPAVILLFFRCYLAVTRRCDSNKRSSITISWRE